MLLIHKGRNLVVLVATHPGVIVLNPAEGHAEFLGSLLCIPWASVKSWGHKKAGLIERGSFTFLAITREHGETSFIFETPRYDEIEACFLKYTSDSTRMHEPFPTRWPPLRYEKVAE